MWLKWFPWRFLVRHLARTQGFLDPFSIFAQIQRFAQPSKLAVPVELLRLTAVLHARGLMNSQAIQHNLDWVWPYWVECQFNPKNEAFVPRAFSLTHINLTHRNWTAVGVPDCDESVLVDPRGLITPFYDGWSIDAWIVSDDGELIPSRLSDVSQNMLMNGNLAVLTQSEHRNLKLSSKTEVIEQQRDPICRIELNATSDLPAWLVLSLRPYNPEGVSFIHEIELLENKKGWKVGRKKCVYLSQAPDQYAFSEYKKGDVYNRLFQDEAIHHVICDVGMATSAALFKIESKIPKKISVEIPISTVSEDKKHWIEVGESVAATKWDESLKGVCKLKVPDSRIQMLFDSAIHSLVLHSPGEIYPGPYTYKHFWFRDATFIIYALLGLNLHERAEKALDQFPKRQTPFGYFHSQEGEWDSNGEALWVMEKYCRMTGSKPKAKWKQSIQRAGQWIQKKRLKDGGSTLHDGLFPAGFSAEHLGPIDYYYWDDFWGVSGLRSAAFLMNEYGEHQYADEFQRESRHFMNAISKSLESVSKRIHSSAMPASPYRRLDTGAIGSIAVSYPLQLWEAKDKRILETVRYLIEECFIDGGFFHDMSHSGINPYLTLEIAQVLLRAGDLRYWQILSDVARIATSTGQWPEAIHPKTKGGCMGDGQHVWASAEWVLMIRSCFVREEGEDQLILCSGIPAAWLENGSEISFGPTLTTFGSFSLLIHQNLNGLTVEWQANWYGRTPQITIRLNGHEPVLVPPNENQFIFSKTVHKR